MSESDYRDADWLYEKYVEEGLAMSEIADEAGCGTSTVYRWLNKHGIETRGGSGKKYRDEDWLRKQYVENRRSTADIADECDTTHSVIAEWLHRFSIRTRNEGGYYEDEDEARFWDKVDTADGDDCWEWQSATDKHGYGQFGFEGTVQLAHRMSFYFENGYWPDPCCLHRCDNPACVNPAHLYEGDQSDNMKDAMARGRLPQAGRDPALSPEEVQDVRQRVEDGGRGIQKRLADEYDVSEDLISRVVNREGAYNG